MTPPPEKAAVFIDTDAGFDDVLAISSLLNANNPKISVPFISTEVVFKNVHIVHLDF